MTIQILHLCVCALIYKMTFLRLWNCDNIVVEDRIWHRTFFSIYFCGKRRKMYLNPFVCCAVLCRWNAPRCFCLLLNFWCRSKNRKNRDTLFKQFIRYCIEFPMISLYIFLYSFASSHCRHRWLRFLCSFFGTKRASLPHGHVTRNRNETMYDQFWSIGNFSDEANVHEMRHMRHALQCKIHIFQENINRRILQCSMI